MGIDVYKILLEKLLFPGNERGLVLIAQTPEPEVEELQRLPGSYAIPLSMFPDSCKVISLPGGEAFLPAAKAALAQHQPTRVFVLPPWLPNRFLSDDLKRQYPREDLESIVLREILEMPVDGIALGVLLPQSFLRASLALPIRQYLVEHHNVRYVVEHAHSPGDLGMPLIDHRAGFSTVLVSRGSSTPRSICFIKYDDTVFNDPSIMFRDVAQLIRQHKNETEHGYIYTGELSEEYELRYDLYHPKRSRELGRLASHFGDMKPLATFVDYVPSLHLTSDAYRLSLRENDSEDGWIPIVSGHSISASGELVREAMEYTISSEFLENHFHLQSGDICMRQIHDFQRAEYFPYLVEVRDDDLPLAAANSVIVIRPKRALNEDERELLRSYIKTDHFYKQLKALGASTHLGKYYLNRVQVPAMGSSLRDALQELRKAETAYSGWISEVKHTRLDLFNLPENKESSIRILSNTRRVRQRYSAALSVDEFAVRVRTRFPHPIAYRWTIIETSYPNYEGYKHVLECAEVTMAYLASISLCLAFEHKKKISVVSTEAEKLGQGKSTGKTFGFWKRLLDEIQREFDGADDSITFYDLLRFPDVSADEALNQLGDEALEHLYEARNDDAHGEGPKGFEVEKAYHAAREQLKNLLRVAEFITEYPLVYIEKTRRDTQTNTTFYDYRKLMGDHYLVPINRSANVKNCELEAGSLYLADRNGGLHLLRPILLYHPASRADRPAIFYLNTYNPANQMCEIRSLEIGDTVELENASGQFFASGLISAI